MDIDTRSTELEWMDTRPFPLPVIKQTLAFLETTNRYFGGTSLVLGFLKTWSSRWPANAMVRILDIGTGCAEIPIAIVQWAQQTGRRVHVTAIDLVAEIAAIARHNTTDHPDIEIRHVDLFDLARTGETFDYTIASLLLHHIPPAETVRALHVLDQISTRGVIISDLWRSRRSYGAVSLLSLLIGNTVVRHDAPLSVKRAFRVEELEHHAIKAGLPYLKAQREPWFRVSLAGEKP